MFDFELIELAIPTAAAAPYMRPAHLLPVALREKINSWRHDKAILALPDRRYVENCLLPLLVAHGAGRVLFVGCRSYTRHYPDLFVGAGIELWTTDIDAFAARYGAPGRHVVGDVARLQAEDFKGAFDVVIFSGVIGFGVNSDMDISRAASALHGLLLPDGMLVLGWNVDRSPDPLHNDIWQRRFERSRVPAFDQRVTFQGCTHVFDYLHPQD